MAHRYYLGETGNLLCDSEFEAWDYGPVLPDVYHECKVFGNKPVKHGFIYSRPFNEQDEEWGVIAGAYNALKDVPEWRLVAATHLVGGVWADVYKPGVRGIKIPNEGIAKEADLIKKKIENR